MKIYRETAGLFKSKLILSEIYVKNIDEILLLKLPKDVTVNTKYNEKRKETELIIGIENYDEYITLHNPYNELFSAYDMKTFNIEYTVYKNHIFYERMVFTMKQKVGDRTWRIEIPYREEYSI